MVDKNNILLITDDTEVANIIKEKLVLLRNNDHITVCQSKDFKKVLEKSLYWTIILHEIDDNKETTLKLIKTIKEVKNDAEILLLLNKINIEFIIKAYDLGINDYLTVDADEYEILIKTINTFKLKTIKTIAKRNEKFLNQLGVIDEKSGLYQYKHLKDIFIDISDDLRIQNGILAIITLDEAVKTKVSTNRLALAIKNILRGEDIIAAAKGGKFYVILPNIDLIGTKFVLDKIQEKMGVDFKIHAGLSKIGIHSFETIDKNAQDSLISAIQNDELYACLSDNTSTGNTWLEDDIKEQKDFKLFKIAFNNKMQNVIIPAFYRYQKECETKLTNTMVSQYTNNIESVFSLKNENLHSELILRFNGYAKFKIEINHSGLDSAENLKFELPLNKITDKEITKLLNQLRQDYKNYAF